jgi:phosphoribosylformylglycinamidine synthase
MAQYVIHVTVMPLEELLDPQGKAVGRGLQALGLTTVSAVRVGKQIRFELQAESQSVAEAMAEEACKSLLANPVMEYFVFRAEAN